MSVPPLTTVPMSPRDELRHLAERLPDAEVRRLISLAESDGFLAPLCCPYCGERMFDLLAWDDEDCESITCETCTTTFDPNGRGALSR